MANPPPTDKISFHKAFHDANYTLIQVTKPLAKVVRESGTFVIRAEPDDFICFCTDSETYRVKEVETTDTVFITEKIEPRNDDDSEAKEYKIQAYIQTFLELTKEEATPYLALKKLFKKYMYHKGDEGDDLMAARITMEDLLNVIPFSGYEIRETLKQLPIVEIDGQLLFLSREVQTDLLNKLVELLDDFDLPDINLNSITFDNLRPYYDSNVRNCFLEWMINTYTNPDGSINQLPFCRDRAITFLEQNHEVTQEVFERQMIRLLPIGVEMDLTALQGIAIFRESIVHGKLIDYVNVDDLPNEPDERFNILFKIKDSWTFEEIEPYVMDFCPNKTATTSFILKYCQQIKKGSSKWLVKKDIDF